MLKRIRTWLTERAGLRTRYQAAIDLSAKLIARNAALQDALVSYREQSRTQQQALSQLLNALVAKAGGEIDISFDLLEAANGLITDAVPDEKRRVVKLTNVVSPADAAGGDCEAGACDCGDEDSIMRGIQL